MDVSHCFVKYTLITCLLLGQALIIQADSKLSYFFQYVLERPFIQLYVWSASTRDTWMGVHNLVGDP